MGGLDRAGVVDNVIAFEQEDCVKPAVGQDRAMVHDRRVGGRVVVNRGFAGPREAAGLGDGERRGIARDADRDPGGDRIADC